MNARELRLLAVAGAGLALVFMARAGDEAPPSVATEGVEEQVDVAVAAGAGSGVGADGSGDLSGNLNDLVGERSIQFVDFGEVAQAPELCEEGLDEDALASLSSIEVSEGVSEVVDSLNLSHLEVVDEVFGDMTGDGVDEAAVHTVCQFGASGRQHEVQVWQSESEAAIPVALVPTPGTDVTGEFPPDVVGLEVVDGALQVTWAQYQEGDPNCCPSGEVTLRYLLEAGEVVLADS